jgi:poly-gamma-glutamate synthesis protein (capsule biosynthesis protein)
LFFPATAFAEGKKSAEIVFTGDIMALAGQLNGARVKGGGYNFSHVFKYVTPIISKADLAIGNLETQIAGSGFKTTDKKKYDHGYPYINAPDSYLQAVCDAGFDVLSTANNHSLDCGEKGLVNTLDAIKKLGMLSTGTFKTKSDRDTPLITEVKGIKFAILSYTFSVNHHEGKLKGEKRSYMVNRLNTGVITKDIAAARKNGADVVIVMPHWGKEGSTKSNAFQKKTAAAIAKAGADLIIGSHPHVIQNTASFVSDTPYGKKTCFVAYSMGNFVSSMGSARNHDSLLLKFRVDMDEDGKVTIGKAQGISAYTFSSFNGKKYLVLPYYNTTTFTDSAKVLKILKNSHNRTSKRLDTKRVTMLK